jgi:hypothetical protein
MECDVPQENVYDPGGFMKRRFLSFAVLAGMALALLPAAQPAAADDSCSAGFDCVDCTKVIVFDPAFCMVPSEPPPPPPDPDPLMGMGPGGSGQVPMPPIPPGMPANPVGAICLDTAEGSPVFASDRDEPVYTFVVGVTYCVNPQTGLLVSVTPVVPTPEPNDERVSIFFGPLEKTLTRIPPGGSATGALVIFELDVNFFPFGVAGSRIETYHHEVGLRITTKPLRVQEPPVRPVFVRTRVTG